MSTVIPREDAEIYWEQDASGTPTEKVLVVRRSVRLANPDTPLRVDKRLRNSVGASSPSWLKSKHRMDTPEGVFASTWLTAPERPTIQAMKNALEQFARIEGCAWADVMLDAIAHDPNYGIQGEED